MATMLPAFLTRNGLWWFPICMAAPVTRAITKHWFGLSAGVPGGAGQLAFGMGLSEYSPSSRTRVESATAACAATSNAAQADTRASLRLTGGIEHESPVDVAPRSSSFSPVDAFEGLLRGLLELRGVAVHAPDARAI